MKIRIVLRKAVLVIMVCLLAVAVIMGTIGNLSHKSYLISLVIAAAFFLVFYESKKRSSILLEKVFKAHTAAKICLFLSILCLLVNGLWVFCFRPLQAADYQTFFRTAVDLSNGADLLQKDYLALFPHILGYSAFLSLFLRVFGQHVMVAAILNVVLTTGSGVLLFVLSLKWAKKTTAVLVYCLWIVCPSKLLYNTMTLSEPYYTFLLLAFLAILSFSFDLKPEKKIKEENNRRWIAILPLGGLAGIVIALVNTARPIGIIPFFALCLWLMFLTDINWLKDNKLFFLLFVGATFIVYAASGYIWRGYITEKLDQLPPSVPGYSVYVGFNPQTLGTYDDEDMALLQDRYFGDYERNAEATQQSMLEDAKLRIQDNKRILPSLMLHKLCVLLGHDEGGAFYSKESMTETAYSVWCLISNIWYYCVCISSVLGCIVLWNHNCGRDTVWLLLLCAIGIILAQLLVEVAARYHYSLIPMLLLLSSFGLQDSSTLKTKLA